MFSISNKNQSSTNLSLFSDSRRKIESEMNASVYPPKFVSKTELQLADWVEYDDSVPFPLLQNHPFSNTGGNTHNIEKSVLQGVNPLPQVSVFIDWLSFTYRPSPEWKNKDDGQYKVTSELAWDLINRLEPVIHFDGVTDTGKGWQGYDSRVNLRSHGENIGLVAFGGNRGSVHVSITGLGCAGIQDFRALQDIMESLPDCKITRADVTYDDLEGACTVEKWREIYINGGFHKVGAKPGCDQQGDWTNQDAPLGRTFYIGSRKLSSKYVCIYEKGKQQGDPQSPWVRIEVRYMARDIIIPFEILTRPEVYFSESYPALEIDGLAKNQSRIEAIKKSMDIAIDHAVDNCQIAYGKLVYFMRHELNLSCEQIVRKLMREGRPSRISMSQATFERYSPVPF